jgi:hypothetical protein
MPVIDVSDARNYLSVSLFRSVQHPLSSSQLNSERMLLRANAIEQSAAP